MNHELYAFEAAVRAGGEVLARDATYPLDATAAKKREQNCQAVLLSTLVREIPHLASVPMLVEERDQASTNLLRAEIPGIRFWQAGDSDGLLVDPCDGTILFQQGCPEYGISIAQLAHGKPIRSALFIPESDILVLADIDEGCFVNGKLVELSDRSGLASSLVGLDLCQEVLLHMSEFHRSANEPLIAAFPYFRNMPSVYSGVELLLGRTIAHVTGNAKIWDVAGTACAVLAAGGTVIDVDGNEPRWDSIDIAPILLACGAHVAEQLCRICSAFFDYAPKSTISTTEERFRLSRKI